MSGRGCGSQSSREGRLLVPVVFGLGDVDRQPVRARTRVWGGGGCAAMETAVRALQRQRAASLGDPRNRRLNRAGDAFTIWLQSLSRRSQAPLAAKKRRSEEAKKTVEACRPFVALVVQDSAPVLPWRAAPLGCHHHRWHWRTSSPPPSQGRILCRTRGSRQATLSREAQFTRTVTQQPHLTDHSATLQPRGSIAMMSNLDYTLAGVEPLPRRL